MSVNFSKTSHIIFFGAVLPACSLFLSWLFFELFPNLPFWVETLSPIYAYALLYSFFDKYVWNWTIFKFCKIVMIPDLRGRWEGKQKSSYKENSNNAEVSSFIEIKQNFSKITVQAYYEKSQSESVVANFYKINDDVYLFYTYDNEPNSLKCGTMEMHKGTVKLKYLPRENKLIGSYFNSIGNRGEMNFDFKQREYLCRFEK